LVIDGFGILLKTLLLPPLAPIELAAITAGAAE
jgi:hypothetical protein